MCVGSPIRDGRSGSVIAALTLCASPEDLDRNLDGYTRSVLRAAQQISSLLGPDVQFTDYTNDLARLAYRSPAAGRERAHDDPASA